MLEFNIKLCTFLWDLAKWDLELGGQQLVTVQ